MKFGGGILHPPECDNHWDFKFNFNFKKVSVVVGAIGNIA